MPELPEVETVVRMLSVLKGRRIEQVSVLHKPSVSGSPQKLEKLTGRTITAVKRRAKYIRLELDEGWGMLVHLRMTGWLGVLEKGVKHPRLNPYIRLRFGLDGGRDELVFSDIRTFGRVWCGSHAQLDALKAISKLGPEPLEISADDFTQRLRARKTRMKALLLNQEFIAGIGNIYADEALFGAGIHPLANSAKITRPRAVALWSEIRSVLSASIEAGGSSVVNFLRPDGEAGWYQRELRIYGRAGEPCKNCGTAIKRIVVGQRGTWFCSQCQRR